MPRGVLALFAAVFAGIALGVPTASSDTDPVSDIAVALAGPTDGQVGDTLTYTATFTNNGPDTPPHGIFYFSYDMTLFDFLGTDFAQCRTQSAGQNRDNQECDVVRPPPGSSTLMHFNLRVKQRSSTTVSAFSSVSFATDPNGSNNVQSMTVLGPPAEVTNSSPPTISGTASVGSTLTANPGAWSPTWNYAYAYVWQRCNPAATCCATLNGGSSYSLTSNDAGCTLRLIVTASDGVATAREGSSPTAEVEPRQTCDPVAGTTGDGGGGGSGGGGGTVPPAPTFSFVSTLRHASLYRNYLAVLVTETTHLLRLALVAGALPTGFGFDDGNHGVGGVARGPGTYAFTVKVTDLETQATAQHEYSLVVDPSHNTASTANSSAVRANLLRTPGTTNPAVTRTTIRQTICVSGWTARVRPSKAYTERLKLRQMRQYQEPGPASSYQEDHLIPLELGGAPRNAKNLWPEPLALAHKRNALEATLQRQVCAGTITLAAARFRISALKHAAG
jgi:hypothetical protein